MPTIVLVHTTFPSLEIAETVSKRILKAGLAACANIHPVDSLYHWDKGMVHEQEISVDFKTSTGRQESLVEFLEKEHPYQVPCICKHNVETSVKYHAWVEVSTSTKGF